MIHMLFTRFKHEKSTAANVRIVSVRFESHFETDCNINLADHGSDKEWHVGGLATPWQQLLCLLKRLGDLKCTHTMLRMKRHT